MFHFLTLLLNFNSIKVRLKLIYDNERGGLYSFQFHKGTIKTGAEKEVSVGIGNFNSIKVRLKPDTARSCLATTVISIP